MNFVVREQREREKVKKKKKKCERMKALNETLPRHPCHRVPYNIFHLIPEHFLVRSLFSNGTKQRMSHL
jgi:PHP family Zn ribbon phosphoesterase